MIAISIRSNAFLSSFVACSLTFAETAHAGPFDGSWSAQRG